MLGRNIERGEIIEVGLDVGAFGDRESHIGENLGDLVGDLADRMDAALRERAFAHRQGYVGAIGGELLDKCSARENLMPRIERFGNTGLQCVDRLPETLAFLRRHRAERLHQLGDATLLAKRLDPHLVELSKIARGRDRLDQLGFQSIELWLSQGKGSCRRWRKCQAPAAAEAALTRLWNACGS